MGTEGRRWASVAPCLCNDFQRPHHKHPYDPPTTTVLLFLRCRASRPVAATHQPAYPSGQLASPPPHPTPPHLLPPLLPGLLPLDDLGADVALHQGSLQLAHLRLGLVHLRGDEEIISGFRSLSTSYH